MYMDGDGRGGGDVQAPRVQGDLLKLVAESNRHAYHGCANRFQLSNRTRNHHHLLIVQ